MEVVLSRLIVPDEKNDRKERDAAGGKINFEIINKAFLLLLKIHIICIKIKQAFYESSYFLSFIVFCYLLSCENIESRSFMFSGR